MLEKLIESTENGSQSKKMRKLLMGIGSLMSAVFVCALIFSIFGTNLAMGGQDIDLRQLVSPAVLPQVEPLPPEKQDTAKPNTPTVSKQISRVINMQRPDETPVSVPREVSTSKNRYRARPNSIFVINTDGDTDGTVSNGNSAGPGVSTGSRGQFGSEQPVAVKNETPVEVKKNVPPPPQLAVKKDVIVSLGVINGKALTLVHPIRSAAATSSSARGAVKVSVLISEEGRVLSANAESGHPLLRQSSVTAALKSTFSPTTLSGNPVKVRGIIVYNFQ